METTNYLKELAAMTFSELCRRPGTYFYIPSYQRRFTWDNDNIDRLFEDIIAGLELVEGAQDSLRFLGAIILFEEKDNDYKTIDPIVRKDLPSRVLTVIDGQQRLVSLMMLAVELHNQLSAKLHSLPDSPLKDAVEQAWSDIKGVLGGLRVDGHPDFYPQLIRADDDRWARKGQERYESPVAKLIHQYHTFRQDNAKKKYNYREKVEEQSLDIHRNSPTEQKARRRIIKHIKDLMGKGEINDAPLPSVAMMLEQDSNYLSFLTQDTAEKLDWGAFLTEDRKKELGLGEDEAVSYSQLDEKENKQVDTCVRLVVFTRYLLDRLRFAQVIVAKDEDYAFDIFEALNTTGKPLTAIETLRPVIIKDLDSETFQKSAQKEHLDEIDDYLSKDSKTKDGKSAELVINFALAEDGSKVSKALRNQRKFLNERYEECRSQDTPNSDPDDATGGGGRGYTHRLLMVSRVFKDLWDKEPKELDRDAIDLKRQIIAGEATCCLRYLADVNHHITRSLIARFYQAYQDSQAYQESEENSETEKFEHLCNAIKAIAAFYTLWRAFRDGVDGIDARYRSFMEDTYSYEAIRKEGMTLEGGFNEAMTSTLNIKKLQERFVEQLKEGGDTPNTGFKTCDEWIKKCQRHPIYSSGAPQKITKFLLLAASHDARVEKGKTDWETGARDAKRINSSAWDDIPNGSVEHIIPQSKDHDFVKSGHLKDIDDVHRIGNLMLLPLKDNQVVSDWDFSKKKEIYQIIGALTDGEQAEFKEQLRKKGVELLDKISEDHYCPMARSVATDEDFEANPVAADEEPPITKRIERRGKNLLESAWETLAVDWLNWDEHH